MSIISINAQSTSVEFPTPVTTNEVKGKIAARDLGDSRLTTHYYYFNGTQGDIFIKILTSNLDGDIDIFVADTLRPITKISVYSDTSGETGREIYLRQPEKLILRIEGRTPTDTAATYSIKFDGSFLAVVPKKGSEGSKPPEIKNTENSEDTVKVNSVGTIIKTPPKPTPSPRTTVNRTPAGASQGKTSVKTPTTTAPKSASTASDTSKSAADDSEKNPETVVTDNLPKDTETAKTIPKTAKTTRTATTRSRTAPTRKTNTSTAKTAAKTSPPANKPTADEELAKALEAVKLVVLFKDGTKIERPMNEVMRVNVDKGILTVISKDGRIGHYSILDIVKMTIQ